ncbi:hypothetical protein JXB41_06810 [Candidatus Woesearchaeota archaeon]|nr:hypothetical protein [Candidatus Woesearchaeota archaeon]
MGFDLDKKNTMQKIIRCDKSKKGFIDKEILDLVNFINSLNDYYTTSSCSGRILLLKQSESNKKHETTWIFSSHKFIKYEDLKKSLDDLPEELVFFRMEAPILHICCRTTEDAVRLLKSANSAGFRRAGIISLSKKITVEIFSTERIDVPVSCKKRLIVTKEYFEFLIKIANQKLKNSRKRIKRFKLLLEQYCH